MCSGLWYAAVNQMTLAPLHIILSQPCCSVDSYLSHTVPLYFGLFFTLEAASQEVKSQIEDAKLILQISTTFPKRYQTTLCYN